jgi:hypothetical protein
MTWSLHIKSTGMAEYRDTDGARFSLRWLMRRTVSSGRSMVLLCGLLRSGTGSTSRFHRSSLFIPLVSMLCTEERLLRVPPLLRRNAGWGGASAGSCSDVLDPLGESTGYIGRAAAVVICSAGWRREMGGRLRDAGNSVVGDVRAERTGERSPESGACAFVNDARRFQAGGGASGSPESCRCSWAMGEGGSLDTRDERERESDNALNGSDTSCTGEGDWFCGISASSCQFG